ncbi:MAG: hypothetical protein ABJ015_05365, partial [Rhodopirellula bahusiensis]
MNRICCVVATIAAVAVTTVGSALTSSAADLPPFSKISEGYKQLPVSDQQAKKGLFNVWQHEKEASVLAELPKNFAGKKYFVALTLSSGDRYAGLQSGDWVVQWRRYNNRLALI